MGRVFISGSSDGLGLMAAQLLIEQGHEVVLHGRNEGRSRVVVALYDTITMTDLALAAYERALEPKKLVTIQGGHFDPYLRQFPTSSATAVAWFREHLS